MRVGAKVSRRLLASFRLYLTPVGEGYGQWCTAYPARL